MYLPGSYTILHSAGLNGTTFNGVTTQILGDQPVDVTNNPATQGTASVTTSALALGTHIITARYLGDTNYEPMNFTLLPNEVIQATPPPV